MQAQSQLVALLLALLLFCSHVSASGYQRTYTKTITKHKNVTTCKKTTTITKTSTYTQPGKAVTTTKTDTTTPVTTIITTSTIIEPALSTTVTTTVTSGTTTVAAPSGFQGVRESLPQATYDPSLLADGGGPSEKKKREAIAELFEREKWTEEKWWKRNNYYGAKTKTIYTTKTQTVRSTKTTTKTSTQTVQGSPTSTATVTTTSTASTSTVTITTTTNIIPPVITKTTTETTFVATTYAACASSNIANAVIEDEETLPIRRFGFTADSTAMDNSVVLGDDVEDGIACCNLFFAMPFASDPENENGTGRPASQGVFIWDSDSQMCVGYYHSVYNCTMQAGDPMNRQTVVSNERPGLEGLVVGNGQCGFIDGNEFGS
ncbi:hypothetical protein CKM354_000893500 [Cercospora kikuchii]|uniref:Uncharacterized protein n=1 Tax=Cercospora kikuchii TaxID=84275 RepID=A0A9P3FIV0_9PEZI|nr:uncharacterized protein CKM354_000893500 [Cercospora kikuchii]GIZ45782.1 hypothetical protein CKM354_000893500 [Cercospora kikuchii]